jgi:hypothetical protein
MNLILRISISLFLLPYPISNRMSIYPPAINVILVLWTTDRTWKLQRNSFLQTSPWRTLLLLVQVGGHVHWGSYLYAPLLKGSGLSDFGSIRHIETGRARWKLCQDRTAKSTGPTSQDAKPRGQPRVHSPHVVL